MKSIYTRVMDRWDWNVAGGAWPVYPETIELSGLENLVKRINPDTKKDTYPLRDYVWRRVYSGRKIDYELVKKDSKDLKR